MKKLMKKYFQEFGRVGGILMIVGFIILGAQFIYQILEKGWYIAMLDVLVAAVMLCIVIYKMAHHST